MYGAGNIGRGFIGKAFYESGYDVCFIDVADDVVNKLNRDGCYPVKIISNEAEKIETVNNVYAVNGRDVDCAAEEIAAADVMATAVGVGALLHIIPVLCAGLKKRFDEGGGPLNIIICENLIDADKYMRALIEKEMGAQYKNVLDQNLGLVSASVGRMVPVMTQEMKEGNILMVWVEPYDELPVDKAAFVGEIPGIKNLVPYTPFGYYIKKKLFVHNMGHAICAYLGWLKGYRFIYQCVADDDIRRVANAAMLETTSALHKEYGIPKRELHDHIEDLLSRFSNQALGDTVERVAKDPLRKLGSNDRLVGAALYCVSMGTEPRHIIGGIAAALRYDNPGDAAAAQMQRLINEKGIGEFLKTHCGVSNDELIDMISKHSAYNMH